MENLGDFAQFFSAFAKFLIFEGRLSTRLYLHSFFKVRAQVEWKLTSFS